MTAHDLIDSIFSRPPWGNMPENMRGLTPRQLKKLNELIDEDAESAAQRRGRGLSTVWAPPGAHKYIVTEDPLGGEKHTLTKLANLGESNEGMLF